MSTFFVVQYYRIDDATSPQDALDRFRCSGSSAYPPEQREVEDWDTGETWGTTSYGDGEEVVVSRHADPR